MSTSSTPLWDISCSPFASFLNTNYFPSSAESAELEALLTEPERELSRIGLEIFQAQAIIDRLTEQKNRVETFIRSHRALLSPIRRLPAETLAEIFTRCLPEGRRPVRTLKDAPLLLTRVSKEWRRISLSTPELWRALHIFVPLLLDAPAIGLREQGSELWLTRAGSLPLSIALVLSPLVFPASHQSLSFEEKSLQSSNKISPFLTMLMKFSTQITDLTLSFDATVSNCFMDAVPALLPALHSLSVGPSPWPERNHTQDNPDTYLKYLLPKAPSLRYLAVAGVPKLSSFPCTWENLTHLILYPNEPGPWSAGPISLSDLSHILERTTQLEVCRAIIDTHESPFKGHDIHLPLLNALSITVQSIGLVGAYRNTVFQEAVEKLDRFFSSLSCPSLSTLSVRWKTRNDMPFKADVPLSFSGILESVETLGLQYPLSCENLIQCLTLAPNLSRLEISDLGYDVLAVSSQQTCYMSEDSLLRSLTWTGLSPRLTEFRAHVYSRSGRDSCFSNTALLEFLEARTGDGQVSKLRVCDIAMPKQDESFSSDDLRRFKSLQEGMELLRIRCYSPKEPTISDQPDAYIGLHPSRSTIFPTIDMEIRDSGRIDIGNFGGLT